MGTAVVELPNRVPPPDPLVPLPPPALVALLAGVVAVVVDVVVEVIASIVSMICSIMICMTMSGLDDAPSPSHLIVRTNSMFDKLKAEAIKAPGRDVE